MAHARQQIRDYLATLLTGLETTGARVFRSRVYPSGDNQIPGLSVYTMLDELVEGRETAGRRQLRELTIEIEGRAKPAEGTELDSQLDDIDAEVSAAIMGDPTLGTRVPWIEWRGSRFSLSGDLERPTGVITMAYVTRYYIISTDPETLIYKGD